MKFSLLIPVYNVENYLRDCLDSVISQVFDDFEVICVDDGSTDSSGKICDEYKAQYPERISVIHKVNEGLVSARRIGLKNAIGEYVCFLDSDDFIVPYFFEVLFQEIQSCNPDIVIFGYNRVDLFGKFVEEVSPPLTGGRYTLQEMSKIRDIVVSSDKLNNLCFKCIKSEIVDIDTDYTKYYSIRNGEDLIQSLPIFDKATTISVIKDCLYLYRSSPNSMTNSRISINNINSWLAMYSVLCEYAERWGYPESVYRQRFGIILKSIFSSLIINRYADAIHKKSEQNELLNRLMENDFQTALQLFRPKKLSIEQFYKYILIPKSRLIARISLVVLGDCYRWLKKY
ncbi:Glycosyl transferase family 2 [Sphaerochaeta associata]|uniref:Glycosyltransferase n=1 Tax=Sphaerochaeta associata TaxID=1129264 RepID=A0ABY4DAZ6_9SPIR|nr:glycosyltransferase family 2 protein [Sphaerochaeta associata]UOM51443.1 glycosyltransferase [Sphaerochaeta associata]SMP65531.1 Glycosyl transferase family 2 [Sphaerochaeta associata]